MSQPLELMKATETVPSAVSGKVRCIPPRRLPNKATRVREYLTPDEVEKLATAAGNGRYGHRDRTLLLLMYRHGLRVSEAVALRWDAVDLSAGALHVARLKNGVDSTITATNWGWLVAVFIASKLWHELGHGVRGDTLRVRPRELNTVLRQPREVPCSHVVEQHVLDIAVFRFW